MRGSRFWATALILGCDSSEPSRTGDRAPVAQVSVAGEPKVLDSTRIVVNGPTLIAFYPVISPADTSEETATVMDDFSHHLSTATDSLKAMGFRIELRVIDSVLIAQDNALVDFKPLKDSADIGYYFARPGRSPMVVYGVRTNADLIQTGRALLSASR